MKHEYDNKIEKVTSAPEIKEFMNIDEYGPLTASEINSSREFGESFKTEEKQKTIHKSTVQKEKLINTIKAINITSMATGVTIVAIGAVMILNQEANANEDYNISFNSVEASENMIWYNIDVGDLDDLTIKLYNDGYEYEVSATSGENFGEFFELEADTEYNLAVCDEKVLKEIKVKTLAPHEVIVTDIEDIKVTYECKCNVDGCFHFKIEYEDTEYTYYGFEAYLMDCNENVVYCDFIYPYNEEQKIDITSLVGGENSVFFVVTCMKDGETYTLIEEMVEI